MKLVEVIREATRRAKNPAYILPVLLFSIEAFYLLFNMFVPQYMPGFGNTIFLVLPERFEILSLVIIGLVAGSLLLGIYPALASRMGFKESFYASCRKYIHLLLSLSIELLLLLAFALLTLRLSGFALSLSSFSVSYVGFYLFLFCLILLISALFIYTLPSIVLGGKNFIYAIMDSVKLAAKSYPKSLILLLLPVAIIALLFFLLILLPLNYTTNIVLVRFFMALFALFEAFVISFALFLFSFGYTDTVK
ncbi:MAG: hypothetical protein SVE93_03855 [Candidatus Thermoplasmatota archaeon]|nr:hypothetical protein [Candidatus Thermoplasmatota archaeon]